MLLQTGKDFWYCQTLLCSRTTYNYWDLQTPGKLQPQGTIKTKQCVDISFTENNAGWLPITWYAAVHWRGSANQGQLHKYSAADAIQCREAANPGRRRKYLAADGRESAWVRSKTVTSTMNSALRKHITAESETLTKRKSPQPRPTNLESSVRTPAVNVLNFVGKYLL